MRLKTNYLATAKDKFAKVVKLILPKLFFLDYVTINWQLPYNELSKHDKELCKNWRRDFYGIIKKRLFILRENNPEINGVLVRIDEHYNLQINFTGKFFINTDNIKDDTYFLYKWFIEFDNMITTYWNIEFIGVSNITTKIPRATISRIDIATQKNSTFLKGYQAIPGNRDVVNEYNIPFKNNRYCSGITIAPEIGRKTQNIFFRAYDKRFSTKTAQTCLERFKSLEFIRKEWMLRSRFLRYNGITVPEDFVNLTINEKALALFIKKIRLSKDCFLFNDTKAYKSLHDMEVRKELKGETNLTLKQFNEIYTMKYGIYLKKIKKSDVKKMLYNPFRQHTGLLKYTKNMNIEEFISFQNMLLRSMQNELYDKYDDKTDKEKKYYDNISEMIEFLKVFKKD